jgi:hypothetical protein
VLETGPFVVEEEPTTMLKREGMTSKYAVKASREAKKKWARMGREEKGEEEGSLPPQQQKEFGKLSGEIRDKKSFRLSDDLSFFIF